jgi:hypothetical protein
LTQKIAKSIARRTERLNEAGESDRRVFGSVMKRESVRTTLEKRSTV